MADEDSLDLDGDDGSITSGPKKSNLFSGMLFTILKWVAIVIGGLILIVTVVVMTNKIMSQKSDDSCVSSSEEYKGKKRHFRGIVPWDKSAQNRVISYLRVLL